jgi:uncharacterized small protein (DUF1192 family)
MKTKFLVGVFLVSVVIMVAIGLLSLRLTNRLLESYDRQEHGFQVIATAATEVSSYAKRAEGHLFLYLALHRIEDKAKFPQRVASLHAQITILDQKLKLAKTRSLLTQIITHSADILAIGNALITEHDLAMKTSGRFDLELHKEAIFLLHEKFSGIRRQGVKLAAVIFEEEHTLKAALYDDAMRLRFFMILFFVTAAAITIYSVHALSQTIATLDEERNRLEALLSKVKTLRGLIPICANCKKIRNDKGYWSQIEAYISEHSDANFSHGICPECAKEIYADIDFDKEGDA